MPRRLSFTRLSLPAQPLLFVAIAFIGGLIAASRISLPIRAWIFVSAASWIVSGAWLGFNRDGWKITALLLIGCFACGGAMWRINESSVADHRVRRMFERGELSLEEPVELFGSLNAAPELAPDRIYLSIEVERLSTLNRERGASGGVQITVPFNDAESRVEYDRLAIDYGSRVRLLCFLSNRQGYRNPGAPDFDEMLEYRGFDATGWVKSPLLIERLGEGKSSAILRGLYRIRSRALAATLRGFSQPASGILAAALWGNRYFLSRDTAESFRAGGTFHLLVISGLHVAMIAAVVLFLAGRLTKSRRLRYSLVIVLMWAYALMVGAQPSITRAVVMLTVVLLGQLIFRDAAGANTLAAAALILLAWQPRDLFNPGFQLSFLTVLVIVAFTSPLYRRLKAIGEWQPAASTPYPPRVPRSVRWLSEALFWNERAFRREMEQSPIRYRLEKARAAVWLNRLRLQPPLAWIVITLLTTVGVQAGLLPLMILHFHRFSIISPIANVVEGALVFALMIAGAAFLAIQFLVGGWAAPLAKAVNALGWLTVNAGDLMLQWPRASFRVPDFGEGWQWVFAAFFLAALILIVCVNEWNPFRKGDERGDAKRKTIGRFASAASTIAMLVIGFLLIIHPFAHQFDRGRLSVTFLDVGQGDSMLIRFPQGKLMLLDSGGRAAFTSSNEVESEEEVFVEDRIGIGEAAVMPFLWHLGIKRLDWIVASHDHPDHVGSFAEVVRGFAIGEAWRGRSDSRDAAPRLFEEAAALARAPMRSIRRGESFDVDGVHVAVLSPDGSEPPMSANNESLLLRLTLGDRSFLLTGDIEKEAEARLVESNLDLRANVLKVAHHGSRTSSTPEFLDRVQPQHAIISVASPSPFGHPHAEAIARLQATGAQLWRTSRCGAITISTDGVDLRVETFVKCGSSERSADTTSRSSLEQ